jgi:hypothetical protein
VARMEDETGGRRLVTDVKLSTTTVPGAYLWGVVAGLAANDAATALEHLAEAAADRAETIGADLLEAHAAAKPPPTFTQDQVEAVRRQSVLPPRPPGAPDQRLPADGPPNQWPVLVIDVRLVVSPGAPGHGTDWVAYGTLASLQSGPWAWSGSATQPFRLGQ